MTDLRKATEMALKFCKDIGELSGPYPYVNKTTIVSDSRKVLQALRQALAQEKETEWVELMKGVRVEGDKVIIATKNNDVARELCGKLIEEKNT